MEKENGTGQVERERERERERAHAMISSLKVDRNKNNHIDGNNDRRKLE